ncbi:MAG: LPP20 family lipoprotein [Bacteroidia bacterium]|nr:LPP20 family lipoprotein [Bacteroidia bacterium]MCF8447260.1 LPP20 family lipoprotein [Bacteroidia bacterium]
MKHLLHLRAIWIVLALALMGCGVHKESVLSNKKPDWVAQRPTNTQYYIGIGYASKLNNAGDFQRVAKKNALDDMLGEIKVTISSNSILSQQQNNQTFNQQFFSDTRMVASETMEGFEVVDSWENKTEYWIYYRMNKADFEAYKRKKIYQASEKALDYLNRADQLNPARDFVQIFNLRIKAAATLQNFLNESIETTYRGKNVFLLNEIISQLQDQLLLANLGSKQNNLKATVGKSLDQPILVFAYYRKDTFNYPISNLPIKLISSGLVFKGNSSVQTQFDGTGQFGLSAIKTQDNMHILQFKPDLETLLLSDSLNASMKSLLVKMECPQITIRIKIDPIKIFMVSNEKNLDQTMNHKILEPVIKKKLLESGCIFVETKDQADYQIELIANTKDLGIIWGTMLRSTFEIQISLYDTKSRSELMHDALNDIIGYQNTKEKAGLEAYKEAINPIMSKVYPGLENALFSTQ